MKTQPSSFSYRALTLFVLALVLLAFLAIVAQRSVQAETNAVSDIEVAIFAAPNFIVDSNVLSPSTQAPEVATVIGRFCNTSGASLTNVMGYIGDYTNGLPGEYPADTSGGVFDGLSFQHLGGRNDAMRVIGDLAAGQCSYQYWSFSYPKTNVAGTIPTWGTSVKPDDDLSLSFDVWAAQDGTVCTGGTACEATHTATMRNEISAMANKIEPNGNPGGRWFNTNQQVVQVGETITTNGILYRLGNINQGFDNNGDLVPDYNAWLQPIGNPTYDPSCFRLVETSGILTVTRSGGNPDLIIPFSHDLNQNFDAPLLYFTDLPSDNTNVTGLVYYTFMALGGPCTIPISPYQEVASGADNEKFNGDYGGGGPGTIETYAPKLTLDKYGPVNTTEGGIAFTYDLPFQNIGTSSMGLSLSSGLGANFMISDTLPIGLEFAGNAVMTFDSGNSGTYTPVIYYSTNRGVSWTTTAPSVGTLSTATNPVMIQWWLDLPLKAGDKGTASFDAQVPTGYITGSGDPFIENCGDARLGGGASFEKACTITVVQGTNALGDFVWQDEDGNGSQDTGETGIENITVTLYWDKNANAKLDSGDVQVGTDVTDANGIYGFTLLPDGDYLVVVDETDPDMPLGYRHTTLTTQAVNLPGSTTNNTLDFGFGPSLALDKTMEGGKGYEGNEISYVLNLTNLRPGGGTAVSPTACEFTVWASLEGTDGFNYNAQSQWINKENAINAGGPDGLYAYSAYANNSNVLFGTGFNTTPQPGSISKVEAIFSIYYNGAFAVSSSDGAKANLILNNNTTTYLATRAFTGNTDLASFGPGVANQGILVWDVTAAKTWAWTDFTSDLDIEFDSVKSGGGDGVTLYLDGLGFRITTNQPCVALSADDILATVPLTDTYDTTLLQYVSSNPPATSVDETTGLISWANVGPINPGETHSVQVNFLALEPNPEVTTDVTNDACSTASTFGDLGAANQACDTVTGPIEPTVELSGVVWSDVAPLGWSNVTTGYTAADFFIPNVTVNLYRCEGLDDPPVFGKTCSTQNGGAAVGEWTFIGSTTTDVDGIYQFTGLKDGYYYVEVDTVSIPGVSAAITPSNGADPDNTNSVWHCTDAACTNNDNLWNDPAANLGTMFRLMYAASAAYPFESAGNVTNINFGYSLAPVLFGTVWFDVNGNGLRESNENGLGNGTSYVQVILRDCGVTPATCGDAGETTTSVYTDANGYYEFTGAFVVANHTYRIEVQESTLPSDVGETWTQTDDPDTTLDSLFTKTIAAGEVSGSHDFGYTKTGTATIGNTVYRDWNGDGNQDAGETGISGVDVTLYLDINNDGSFDITQDAVFTATKITNLSGHYSFTVPGGYNYFVVLDETDLPATYVQTQDPDEAGVCSICNGRSTVNSVVNDTSYLDEDFGYHPKGYGIIGDLVWQDNDADGVQDAGEPGLANILVSLYIDNNTDGKVDSGDAFVREASTDASGNYQFDFLAAGNYLVVVDESDPQLPVDGNGDPYILSTGNNPLVVTLIASQTYLDADFGFTPSGLIGDFVWQDNNGNGTPDSGEPGIDGVTVKLYKDNDLNGISSAGDTLVDTQVTAGGGLYAFIGLREGNYVVVVDETSAALLNFTLTGDPDAYGNGGVFAPPCSTVSGYALCDHQYGIFTPPTAPAGTPPGLRAGQADRTADFGYRPSAYLGDTLWIDGNGNGSRDIGESGIPFVTVRLCSVSDCSSGTVLTTETDIDGYYSFGNIPDSVTPYYLNVDTSDPDFTALGSITNTYDPDGTASSSTTVTVTGGVTTAVGNCSNGAGTCSLTGDFGYRYVGTQTITGTVFFDAGNEGGLYIPGTDSPYAGVTVYLWRCVGSCGGTDDVLVGSTTTTSSGLYTFGALPDGTYQIAVHKGSPQLSSLTETREPDADTCILAGPCNGSASVTLTGTGATSLDFGFYASLDFGDLPNTYNDTLAADNGARHSIGTVYLGSSPSAEVDGKENDTAAGDTDEGVVPIGPWGSGTGSVSVDVVCPVGTCYVSGWIDWNQNQKFDDPNERIILDKALPEGTDQMVSFNIPSGIPGLTDQIFFARFRLYPASTGGFAQPTGFVTNGEVEDYRWTLKPTAVTLQSLEVHSQSPVYGLVMLGLLVVSGVGVWFFRRRKAAR